MSSRIRLAVLFVSTPVLAFALVGGFFGRATAGEDTYQHLRIFEDVVSLITSNYVEEIDLSRVMMGAMRGLADGLDPESSHLSRDEVRAVESSEAADEGQVGIAVTRQYYLRVVAARDGSPAEQAGIRTGDFIRGIDSAPSRDLSLFRGRRLLRGQAGSTVSLTVIRGSAAEPHVVELVREVSPPVELTSRIVAPGLGYIRIPAFDASVRTQLETHAAELERGGVDRLIIDVRNNAEGPIASGIEAARPFVAEGSLARREARGQIIETMTAQSGDGAVTMPLALLVGRGTAGAAETFAAALAGNDRAEMFGERSLGQTAEQRLVKLPDGSGLWMSWAMLEGPGELEVNSVGLRPDVEVDEPDVEFGQPSPADDRTLDAAIEHMALRPAA